MESIAKMGIANGKAERTIPRKFAQPHEQTVSSRPSLVGRFRALVGREIAKSEWFTIAQDRIDAFAELTGDKQWTHVDATA